MGLLKLYLDVDAPWVAEVAVYAALVYAALTLLTFIHFARYHKFKIPGPTFVVPLIGGIVHMMRDPTGFWDQQRDYATGRGYSWNTIISQFVIFVTRADLCHKVFENNSKESFGLELHPNGKILLGDNNIAFQTGPLHKALRTSFMNLFTNKALSMYLKAQEQCIRTHLTKWTHDFGSDYHEMRDHIRVLNFDTSQTVFVGPRLKDKASFTRDYMLTTDGFLATTVGPFIRDALCSLRKVAMRSSGVAQNTVSASSALNRKGRASTGQRRTAHVFLTHRQDRSRRGGFAIVIHGSSRSTLFQCRHAPTCWHRV